jgi:hypothetical protein
MKDKRCFICKYQGKIQLETFQNEIFSPRGKGLTIMLCYGHSIELFKMGQANFMIKYKSDFTNFYGFEDDKLAINYFNYR